MPSAPRPYPPIVLLLRNAMNIVRNMTEMTTITMLCLSWYYLSHPCRLTISSWSCIWPSSTSMLGTNGSLRNSRVVIRPMLLTDRVLIVITMVLPVILAAVQMQRVDRPVWVSSDVVVRSQCRMSTVATRQVGYKVELYIDWIMITNCTFSSCARQS